MDESKAHTQMTPGAIARSRFGSAPMPNGKRLATMTKKSSAVARSLRRRQASSKSRNTTQRATASTSAELDDARRDDAGILVRRERHRPAASEVLLQLLVQELDATGVEGRERLVEQPQRQRLAQREPREHGPPALALREPS